MNDSKIEMRTNLTIIQFDMSKYIPVQVKLVGWKEPSH